MSSLILVVEDDVAISELLSMNLEVAGYRYEVANNGRQALEMLKEQKYDLALLDIMLPGLSGYDLLPHMEAHNIPVIYLTARNSVADKVKGLKMGAEDYIVKPFEMMELLARVEKVLARHGNKHKLLTAYDLELDTEERVVRQSGEVVQLTPMEFTLLEMLMRNVNIALSRDRLLETVWGYDFSGDTRTVDIHIQKLRKKLGWEEHIKTVYKLGYRLEV